jgi:hypothetical protein
MRFFKKLTPALVIVILTTAFLPGLGMADTVDEATKAGVATATGAGLGYGVVYLTGMTAVGAVGSGAGVGAAAGPVGAAIGAGLGLAAYGVYRIFY